MSSLDQPVPFLEIEVRYQNDLKENNKNNKEFVSDSIKCTKFIIIISLEKVKDSTE